ncbi:MAG TPA: DEAD/DEAH box helicase [Bacteroidales bacterium]|nr:DEAD/DEAH box helicase [Bacteroidales bacterium]
MNLFKEAGLGEDVLHAIGELGFEAPTPIQEKVIPQILSSPDDLIGLAQTGTGKTAAFGLPVIEQTDVGSKATQTLILSPTRELCLQITKDLKTYARYKGKIGVVPVYGGASAETQIKELRSNAQIVVGTPGRVLDLIKRKKLNISNISRLILDEADEMLSMGFKEELDAILERASSEKQVLLFSATMARDIANIARRYMVNPVEISVGKRNTGAANVQHMYCMVHARDRYQALRRIVDMNPNLYGIVFCRTRRETREVAEQLMEEGYNADALHGDLSQAQRDAIMKKFRIKNLQLLVATDVAARGIDVDDLTHIINYNLPDDSEIYVHRTGRTGRVGKKGVAVSLIQKRDVSKIYSLEKMVGKEFQLMKVPGAHEIVKKQLFSYIDQVESTQVDEDRISQFLPEILKKMDWLDKEELLKRFVSLEFSRLLSYYDKAPDLNVKEAPAPDKSKKSRRDKNVRFTRFFINQGKKQKMDTRGLLKLINQNMNNRSVEIGKIDVQNNFSFFSLDARYEQEALKVFQKAKFNGSQVEVNLAKRVRERV